MATNYLFSCSSDWSSFLHACLKELTSHPLFFSQFVQFAVSKLVLLVEFGLVVFLISFLIIPLDALPGAFSDCTAKNCLENPCLNEKFRKKPFCDHLLDIDARVDDLISRLTIKEKIKALVSYTFLCHFCDTTFCFQSHSK